MELKVFYNGTDYVIAPNKARATQIWERYTGDEWDGGLESEWRELPPTKKFKGMYRRVDDNVQEAWANLAENAGVTIKTVYGVDLEVEAPLSEWIDLYGEGWFTTLN